ncbi:MAG: hypothetical protein CM1200mP26_11810 [Acidimicrobiales bacterium]|nr:MAG: hypothetical protein CM1200mP26_11810 [Acidimicrobiales bacterium]
MIRVWEHSSWRLWPPSPFHDRQRLLECDQGDRTLVLLEQMLGEAQEVVDIRLGGFPQNLIPEGFWVHAWLPWDVTDRAGSASRR